MAYFIYVIQIYTNGRWQPYRINCRVLMKLVGDRKLVENLWVEIEQ